MAIQHEAHSIERGTPRRDGWQRRPLARGDADRLARGLGWFSIGLGLAEIAAPGGVARLAGLPYRPGLIRLCGLREVASGVGILTQRRPAGGLWSRVAGDVVDLSLLGAAYRSREAQRGRLTLAAASVVGVTALDVIAAQRMTSRRAEGAPGIRVATSIAVMRPPEELYRFWHDFENLPRFMRHLESVRVLDAKRSHWVARAPAGMTVEWDAEIVDDRPNELIAWRSLPGSTVEHAGSVRFSQAPGGRGTYVTVEFEYNPPGGGAAAYLAKLFGEEPGQQVKEDLRRFKQLVETGEIPTTEGQPSARSVARRLWKRSRS